MENSRIIKSITPATCPGCGEDIYICHQQVPPVVSWVLKEENITAAKETLKQEVEKIKFKNNENKQLVLSWLDNPETIFGPEDVDSYIEQIKQAQENEE